MKAAVWMMAGGVMITAGCSMFSRNGASSCDGSGACALPGTSACTAGAVQIAPSAHPDSRNWRSLFNLDLSNAVCTPGVWFYNEKGDLTANKDEAIWTDRDYENFVIDLEYRCDPAANSGVLIYCSDITNWIPNAVEIQILDDNHPHWAKEQPFARNGGLYGHLPPKVNNANPAGEWNRMTITAQGKHIQVRVNEEITVDADLSVWTSAKKNPDGTDIPPWLSRPWAELPTRGRIGLQGKHGNAAIYFRNVRVKEL
ncbi:MAG TPA: DUF1080 domain-containing protein [Kiritimatiellia bacterium]|nr:DUF1080 domain-containing protein [Kiritimatiellia bacterium]HRU71271.1 DUF1080 domain-containing protein [Kiritimatiellia bacterium]